MAAASSFLTHPTTSYGNLAFPSNRTSFCSPPPQTQFSFPRPPADQGVYSTAALCRCSSGKDSEDGVAGDSPLVRWGIGVIELVKNAGRALGIGEEEVVGGGGGEAEKKKGVVEEGEWDWERWKKHFVEIDEQELLISLLKVVLWLFPNGSRLMDLSRVFPWLLRL